MLQQREAAFAEERKKFEAELKRKEDALKAAALVAEEQRKNGIM